MNDEVQEDAVVTEEVETVETETVDTETVEATETEGGEAEAQETETEDNPEPSDSSPEKKDGVQKRIDELTKLRRDQERETEYWKQLAQNKQAAPEPVKSEPLKTLKDFEYDESLYGEYVVDRAKADAAADTDRKLEVESRSRTQAEFKIKEADFSKTVDDYHISTMVNDGSFKFSQDMAHLTEMSDEGPALRYYLSKNLEVSASIASMDILSAAMELGAIKATKLVKQKAPSVSKAPKPVPKIAASDGAAAPKLGDPNLSDKQFRKLREKQIANR